MPTLLDDGLHFVFEAHLDESISFIKDEHLNIVKREALSVMHVVEKSTCSCNNKVWDAL